MRGLVPAILFSTLAIGAAGVVEAQTPSASVHAAYAVEPFAPSTPITIQGAGVRLRAEPFATTDTTVLSSGSTGLALAVVGLARQPDWNWYQVVLKNGQKAFVRSDLTSAPSRGGTGGVSLTPAAALAPVTPPVVSTAPAYQPPSSPAWQPPSPAWQPPTPAAGAPAPPLGPPISLTPKSAPPPDAWLPPSKEPDASGLLSNPPNQ